MCFPIDRLSSCKGLTHSYEEYIENPDGDEVDEDNAGEDEEAMMNQGEDQANIIVSRFILLLPELFAYCHRKRADFLRNRALRRKKVGKEPEKRPRRMRSGSPRRT